jgi:two-component system, LytTR family, response regulator
MTFIALDDEPLALVLIEKLTQSIPDWQLVGTFTDAGAASVFLRDNTVDLLLSDINMPDISGLQFVRDLPDERPMVIFLTAHKEHAHEGFDLDVVDYLIKPVSPERFDKALSKAANLYELRRKAEQSASPLQMPADHFFVFSEYQQVKITVSEILYLESMGDYVKIHLAGQKRPIVTLGRLKHFADLLTDSGFRRIHRSYIINLVKITAKQKGQVRIGDIWLPVGDTYGIN